MPASEKVLFGRWRGIGDLLRQPVAGIGLVVLATACWSTSGLFISLIMQAGHISPVGLAFLRDLSSFLCFLAGVGYFRRDLLRVAVEDLPWLFAMGVLSIGLFHVLWIYSVLANGVSLATIIQSNAPIFVAIVAWLAWRESLTWDKLAALILAVLGTYLIARPSGSSTVSASGLLIGLGTVFSFGSFSLLGKKLTRGYGAWTVLVYVFGFAAMILSPSLLISGVPQLDSPALLGYFAGLVLVSTVFGFVLFTAGLRRLEASVASMTASTEIIFAALLSYLVLGERLDRWQIAGAACIVVGVVLVSRRTGRAPEQVQKIA